MKVAVVVLLLILVAANVVVFAFAERFTVAPGDEMCVLDPNVKSCSLEIQEDASTLSWDKKCRRIAGAMGGIGTYARTSNHVLDNGRLRTSDTDDDVCTLLMSDDLVQSPAYAEEVHDCSKNNTHLFKQNSYHANVVDTIHRNGPYCELRFKDTATEVDLDKYVTYLRENANAIMEARIL